MIGQNDHLFDPCLKLYDPLMSSGPADPDGGGLLWCSQNEHWTILGQVSSSRMHFARRPEALPKFQPHHRSYPSRICLQSLQLHPQTDTRTNVLQELGLSPVLAHHQVHSPISVKIRCCRSSLLPINFDPRLLSWNRPQPAFAVPQ